VHVALGPLPSESARAWLAYARHVVVTPRAHDAETLNDEIRHAFESYLTEWDKAAADDPVFRWETEVDGELVEYLVHAFYRVAVRLSEEAERRGGRLAPPEGDIFYAALVRALLDAMEAETVAAAEFAGHLRAFWPGVAAEELTR
jgi:hypothetical protein